MEENSINSRLVELIEKLGLNKNSFAVKIGSTGQALHHIIGGRLNEPGSKIYKGIAKAFPDVNLNWLISGEGEVFKSNSIEKAKSLIKNAQEENIKQRVIDLENTTKFNEKMIDKHTEDISVIKHKLGISTS